MSISSKSISLLEDQRTVAQEFFNQQKLNAQQIINVDTQLLPARVIAYQYYGESTLGADIAVLNDEINVSFLSGNIKIFTA